MRIMLEGRQTQLLIILASILVALLLFLLPILLIVRYRRQQEQARKRNSHLQLNEEQFRQNIEDLRRNGGEQVERPPNYADFPEEELADGVPRR